MKNIQIKLFIFLFIALTFPHFGSAQDSNELRFEVNRIHPYISITKEKLSDANSLMDLNSFYKSSWIKEYISVEIFTSSEGRILKAVSKNDILSLEQKEIMNEADMGSNIMVKVLYLPENTLANNDKKEMDFSFNIIPEQEAEYVSGQQELDNYLKETAIDKIPSGSFKNYDLAAIKFAVNEDGHIINAHVFQPSKDKKIDELLLETICNMPNWNPAEYANGVNVKQEFVLTVGNMENCIVGLLNIHKKELVVND